MQIESIDNIAANIEKNLAGMQELSKQLECSRKKWGWSFSVASIKKAHPNYSLVRCQRVFKNIVRFRDNSCIDLRDNLPLVLLLDVSKLSEMTKLSSRVATPEKYKALIERTKDTLLDLLKTPEKYYVTAVAEMGSGIKSSYRERAEKLEPPLNLIFSKMQKLITKKDFKGVQNFLLDMYMGKNTLNKDV
ncbi:MAG: hypothetical protein L7U87_04825 [Chlamydiales bacterium]|nr:hypothetical protein [Chlamydiales bacterium]